MDADGRSLLSVSDAGSWLTADLAYEGERPMRLDGCPHRPAACPRRRLP